MFAAAAAATTADSGNRFIYSDSLVEIIGLYSTLISTMRGSAADHSWQVLIPRLTRGHMVHYPEYLLVCLQACKKRRWMEVTENEDANDGGKNECGGKTHLCWAEPSAVVDPVEILQLESSHH